MRNKTKTLNVAEAATAATVGYEAQLWQMADALRGSMDAAEYRHVCLSLLFLKYISDAFEAKHAELAAQKAEGADPEDPDEYRAASIFWVPKEARWSHLLANPLFNDSDRHGEPGMPFHKGACGIGATFCGHVLAARA